MYDSYSLSLFLFVSHSRGCECSKSTLLVVPLGGPYYVGGCDLCWALPLPIVSSATAILVIVWGVCLGSNPDYTGDDLCLPHVIIPPQHDTMTYQGHGTSEKVPIRLTSRMGGVGWDLANSLKVKNDANICLCRVDLNMENTDAVAAAMALKRKNEADGATKSQDENLGLGSTGDASKKQKIDDLTAMDTDGGRDQTAEESSDDPDDDKPGDTRRPTPDEDLKEPEHEEGARPNSEPGILG